MASIETEADYSTKESVKQFESYVIAIGRDYDFAMYNEVIKINLDRPDNVSSLPPVPTEFHMEAAAAVYCNSIFVTGLGKNLDEIWKFKAASFSWKQLASLNRGRRGHCVAFVNHVLYICGGHIDSYKNVLDDVEAYDTILNKCEHNGKLKYSFTSAGNCVPFKDSLYIFGGLDVESDALSSVQVYDTKTNTCSLLSNPMPCSHSLLQAVLWNNSVILLNGFGCLIYNFDTEIWQLRDRFKTNVVQFGLTFANGNIFVIGGGFWPTDADGNVKWKIIDDIKSVPIENILNDEPIEWRHRAKLPGPLVVDTFGEILL